MRKAGEPGQTSQQCCDAKMKRCRPAGALGHQALSHEAAAPVG